MNGVILIRAESSVAVQTDPDNDIKLQSLSMIRPTSAGAACGPFCVPRCAYYKYMGILVDIKGFTEEASNALLRQADREDGGLVAMMVGVVLNTESL
ncbi:hypothetical protein KUCAC02_021639 [Chaenocephalus aceratus]|uniref:Uncharacterized protein n=1 Tax=Chaenocephalus aceratus TaxID=36190 RepID=A0ACB9XHS4_CHAAC|nr:hypothetical protein KUCAC02_021639 [Chaenocephalus aceratus]